jgi:predicted transposase/invertase (TIGR01784 family)
MWFLNRYSTYNILKLLLIFLKAVLDLPAEEYQDIRITDPHLLRKHKDGKLGILDLRIVTKSGNSIAVELQVSPQPSIWKRLEYYNARLLTDQIGSGNNYEQINRAVSILISYPVLLENTRELHTRFRWFDERINISYPDSSEIHILEVQKAKNAGDSPLANWLRFFAAESTEDYEMIAQTRPAIASAWGVVQYLSGDEEARRLAEYEEMARRDEADRQKGAYNEGLQEGLQAGRQEDNLALARNALRKNMAHDMISDITGLSLDEIKQLAAELS